MSLQIDEAKIRQAIQAFLTAQYDKKTEKEQKQLTKALHDNDEAKAAELRVFLNSKQEEYQKDIRLTYMADWMSKQLSLGTHISKSVHSSSKGDNLIFDVKHHHDFVGHHHLKQPAIDASGNAAALPLSAFLNFPVTDEITIGHLIAQKHPALKGVFHSDAMESERLQDIFYQVVLSQVNQPKTDERNKQLLWAKSEDDYVSVVPLYPMSVVHYVYNAIQDIRFSETNTLARKNRSKTNVIQTDYVTIHNLAVLNIGGSNPQGVSKLMSKQGGRNYLLPSLPPKFKGSGSIRIAPYSQSIFESKSVEYYIKDDLQAVFEIVQSIKNNVDIRDKRKLAIGKMIACIFEVAMDIQQNRIAGWSKEKAYENLPMFEKYWLDPNRSELDGEEEFKNNRENQDWHNDIAQRFANWLQKVIKERFSEIKHDFGEPEYHEWFKEMQTEIKKAIRLGTGVF